MRINLSSSISESLRCLFQIIHNPSSSVKGSNNDNSDDGNDNIRSHATARDDNDDDDDNEMIDFIDKHPLFQNIGPKNDKLKIMNYNEITIINERKDDQTRCSSIMHDDYNYDDDDDDITMDWYSQSFYEGFDYNYNIDDDDDVMNLSFDDERFYDANRKRSNRCDKSSAIEEENDNDIIDEKHFLHKLLLPYEKSSNDNSDVNEMRENTMSISEIDNGIDDSSDVNESLIIPFIGLINNISLDENDDNDDIKAIKILPTEHDKNANSSGAKENKINKDLEDIDLLSYQIESQFSSSSSSLCGEKRININDAPKSLIKNNIEELSCEFERKVSLSSSVRRIEVLDNNKVFQNYKENEIRELKEMELLCYEIEREFSPLLLAESKIKRASNEKPRKWNKNPKIWNDNKGKKLKQINKLSLDIKSQFLLTSSSSLSDSKTEGYITESDQEHLKKFAVSAELKQLIEKRRMLNDASSNLDMSKNETEKSLLKQFETTKELKEVMVKKCNYSSFVGIDMSKNEKEKSILKQFRTTEELKNAMEKKCNLSDKLLQVDKKKKETKQNETLKQFRMSMELETIMKRKRVDEMKIKSVEGKENSMNVLNNNDSNKGLLKQFKVSKELQMIMKRKRQEEEKEQQISTNLHDSN